MVTYHYIRDDSNFKCFTTQQFRNQIDALRKKYQFVTVKELLTKKSLEPTCCLTFDDGIKDCITNVLPILQEYDISASFLIPMKLLIRKEISLVQKRHLLFSKLGDIGFVNEFNKVVDDFFHVEELGITSNYDNELISSFKYILDNMDKSICKYIIGGIFNKYFDEEEEFKQIYLNKQDLHNLYDSGMEIGTHSFSHCHLDKLYFEDMKNEIELSAGVYENEFGCLPFVISYPMGSYNLLVKKMLKKVGYQAGLTTKKDRNFIHTDLFEMNRYDCIDNPEYL